jgi:hypothetical protein
MVRQLPDFPWCGKIAKHFSMVWKTFEPRVPASGPPGREGGKEEFAGRSKGAVDRAGRSGQNILGAQEVPESKNNKEIP